MLKLQILFLVVIEFLFLIETWIHICSISLKLNGMRKWSQEYIEITDA